MNYTFRPKYNTRYLARTSGDNCEICGRPILEGRANYTKAKFGKMICGSQKYESNCEYIRKQELAEPN